MRERLQGIKETAVNFSREVDKASIAVGIGLLTISPLVPAVIPAATSLIIGSSVTLAMSRNASIK